MLFKYNQTNNPTIIPALLDEDDLISNSDQQAATQQSIKSYVDDRVSLTEVTYSNSANIDGFLASFVEERSFRIRLLPGVTLSSTSATFSLFSSTVGDYTVVDNQPNQFTETSSTAQIYRVIVNSDATTVRLDLLSNGDQLKKLTMVSLPSTNFNVTTENVYVFDTESDGLSRYLSYNSARGFLTVTRRCVLSIRSTQRFLSSVQRSQIGTRIRRVRGGSILDSNITTTYMRAVSNHTVDTTNCFLEGEFLVGDQISVVSSKRPQTPNGTGVLIGTPTLAIQLIKN